MRTSDIRLAAILAVLVPVVVRAQEPQTCTLPHPRAVEQVDDYFGTKVADPYRWLENTDSPETRAWVDSENCVTSATWPASPSAPGSSIV